MLQSPYPGSKCFLNSLEDLDICDFMTVLSGQQYSSWDLTRDLYRVNIVVLSLALKALRAQDAIAHAFVAILFTWRDHESVNKQFTYEWQLKYQGIWAMAVDNVLKFVLMESHVILSCPLNYRVQILLQKIDI